MPSRENSERLLHVLGNYEIFDELGRGGMGIVYRGLDLSLDRPVAMKLLRDDLRMQPMIVSRFAREARAAASLDHSNIVQIYSVGESDRTPYIAMEFVDSEPLSALMIRERTLPWQRAFAIASQVAAALASAHDAQIIHRDVKPPNILMTPDDKAYVTDFGIAKILSMHDQLTLDGTKLGTPQYMSPERCKTGDASASSDLYSLGVLLFQMISGRLPHEGNSSTELVRRILSQPPARLKGFVPHVPDDVERLIAWLIEARPENRPASALEAREALERVRAGQRLDINDSAVSRAIAEFRLHSKPQMRRKPSRRRTAAAPRRKLSVLHRRVGIGVAALAALMIGWGAGAMFREGPDDVSAGQQAVSNWYVSKDAASFLREAENVWIAHLADSDLRIQRVAWSDAAKAFVLMTSGGTENRDNVRRAILAVQPSARVARAVAPRLDNESSVFDFDSHGGFADQQSGSAITLAGITAPAVRETVGAARVEDVARWALHPNGSRVLYVVREAGGRETLFEQALGEPGISRASGARIETAAYSTDGGRYIFSLRESNGILSVYSGSVESAARPMLTWQGSAALEPGGVSPDGSRMVVTGADSVLIDVPLAGMRGERVLGEGAGAVWIDSKHVVALAADTRGELQLWAVAVDGDAPRRQLSFIEGGVEGPPVASAEGTWVAALPNSGERTALLLLRFPSDDH